MIPQKPTTAQQMELSDIVWLLCVKMCSKEKAFWLTADPSSWFHVNVWTLSTDKKAKVSHSCWKFQIKTFKPLED